MPKKEVGIIKVNDGRTEGNYKYFVNFNVDNSVGFTKNKEMATKINLENIQDIISKLEKHMEYKIFVEELPHKEVERKWLFDSEIAPFGTKLLCEFFYNQAYLTTNPEVRIRSKHIVGENETTYKLCIKSKGTIERIEVEKELTKEEFDQLMIVGNIKEEDIIKKHVYTYDIDGYKLTVGITDKDKESEFRYGEIEFHTIEEAMAFEAPRWFGQEVTYRKDYKMANYWERTRLTK